MEKGDLMDGWKFSFSADCTRQGEAEWRLSLDSAQDHGFCRAWVPSVIDTPDKVLRAATDLRRLADYLEREAHRLSTSEEP